MKTVGEVAEFVAPYIGKRWPYDKQAVLDVLYLTAEEIWNSGKFYNSTKWFYVSTTSDNKIVTPHGYSVLLGFNQNFKPVALRSDSFLFHQNGAGDLPFASGYVKDVVDLGEYPVFKMLDILCKPCEGMECKKFKIGARVLGNCLSYPKTRIYGLDDKGNPIYSYVKGENEEVCQCTQEESSLYDEAIEGLELSLSGTVRSYDIWFSKITGFIKEQTNSPVEYYAIDELGLATLIARMEAFESTTSYRIYQVPRSCVKQQCALGLFKIKKPNRYISESEIFITDDLKSTLSIAMGVDKKYRKNEMQEGMQYITDGILSLANNLREQSSNTEDPIQVSNSNVAKKRNFV